MPPLKNSFNRFILSTLSGVMLWLCWPERGWTPLIFLSFIPLLFVENWYSKNDVKRSSFKLFVHFYWSMLLRNVLTTWWVYNSTSVGSFLAFGFNSLFMAIVLLLFHLSKKKLGVVIGYLSLIIYWIAFEYLHLHWDLSWPWLTLGNVFAMRPEYVQWYEFTGVLGGDIMGAHCKSFSSPSPSPEIFLTVIFSFN